MDFLAGTVEEAALGRPFGLGMLYDCLEDALIPGLTLWSHEALQTGTNETHQHSTAFKIIASDSIEDKSSALDIGNSLKASLLCGLVDVEGSAKYLRDTKKSESQARITLKYKATTTFKSLSMNHLGTDHIEYRDVLETGLATHVVTGILYGAQAFFVFDSTKSEGGRRRDLQGNMKVAIGTITHAGQDDVALKMSDNDEALTKTFSCKFHGDFNLETNPTSFEDAVKIYQSLPKLLGANGENAVPLKVWLTPLKSSNPKAARLVNQMSAGLVREVQNSLEDFRRLEMRCNDMMEDRVAQYFPQVAKRLRDFKEMFLDYKFTLQQAMAESLPSIRGGGEEEHVLTEVFGRRHSSPFSHEELSEWMDCKEKELLVLRSYIDMVETTKTRIVSTWGELQREVQAVDCVVCFAFTSLENNEPYLDSLSNSLKSCKTEKSTQGLSLRDEILEQWYNSVQVRAKMKEDATLFCSLASCNRHRKDIRFLIAAIANDKHKGASIYVFMDGSQVTDALESLSEPERSEATGGCGSEAVGRVRCETLLEAEHPSGSETGSKDDQESNATPNMKTMCAKTTEKVVSFLRTMKMKAHRTCDAWELTLDPHTAHRALSVLGDRRPDPDPPERPERFDVYRQVLCREGLAGRFYWEVRWSGRVSVGVAYRGLGRKGRGPECRLGANGVSWCLRCRPDGYSARHAGHQTAVHVSPTHCRRVGVALDWAAGTLSFYRVSSFRKTLLHTFQARFTEALYPGFSLEEAGASVGLFNALCAHTTRCQEDGGHTTRCQEVRGHGTPPGGQRAHHALPGGRGSHHALCLGRGPCLQVRGHTTRCQEDGGHTTHFV